MKKNSYTLLVPVLFLMVMLGTASCKKKTAEENFDNVKGSYFSIKQFELDQWNTWAGLPFLINKTITVDKRIDSSLTNSDTISWAPIFKTFAETDISDHKFLGKYAFNQFDDPQDGTHNFYYRAKDEDLFTQKLLITIDQNNMKVRGIYIETFKKSITGERIQRLYYQPMKVIQIQTDERPMVGSKKLTVEEWSFQR